MILLIDNYDSFTYNLYQLIGQYYPHVEVVRNDKITLNEIRTLNPKAIILSPGPGHPTEAGLCIDIINTFSGMIPILGVCLGHQAIVHAFGGNVIRANQLFHGKPSLMNHHQQGLFSEVQSPFEAGRYHSLVAEASSFPEVLEIHAKCEPDVIMAVKHKDHPTYGLQFHPESILTPLGHSLIEVFLKEAGAV